MKNSCKLGGGDILTSEILKHETFEDFYKEWSDWANTYGLTSDPKDYLKSLWNDAHKELPIKRSKVEPIESAPEKIVPTTPHIETPEKKRKSTNKKE